VTGLLQGCEVNVSESDGLWRVFKEVAGAF